MNPQTKEEKLREQCKNVLENQDNKEIFNYLFQKLNLSKEETIQAYVNYDMDVFAYENEIYESLAMGFVLYVKYLMGESWHRERQNAIQEMINQAQPTSIADMGFGVPSKYLKEYVIPKKIKTTLVDIYKSAFDFTEILLEKLEPSWGSFIFFKQLDMNAHEVVENVDCYIFQDSIEHVKNSTEYLTKTVESASNNTRFILSLPIGPIVPAHTISWDTKEDAIQWLEKCGLKLESKKTVYVNPEVDLFADKLNKEFYNLIVLSRK